METFLHFIYINLDRGPLLYLFQIETPQHVQNHYRAFGLQGCFAENRRLESAEPDSTGTASSVLLNETT